MQTTNPKKSFRLGPRESLAAFGIAAGMLGLWMIQFENVLWFGLASIVLLFSITIWFQRGWAVYLLFANLLILKFIDVSSHPRSQLSVVDGWDVLFTVVAISFAGCCFRYLELSRYIRAFYPDLRTSAEASEDRGFQFPSLVGGRWWLIPIAIGLAALLLVAFPNDPESVRRYWITPTGARMIFLGFFLFFSWFVCRSIVSIAIRKKMDPDQASIRVRSMIANEFWREQLPIETVRAKLRRREVEVNRSR
jgi:hypothetical protein